MWWLKYTVLLSAEEGEAETNSEESHGEQIQLKNATGPLMTYCLMQGGRGAGQIGDRFSVVGVTK